MIWYANPISKLLQLQTKFLAKYRMFEKIDKYRMFEKQFLLRRKFKILAERFFCLILINPLI